jgi:hypothetical protein
MKRILNKSYIPGKVAMRDLSKPVYDRGILWFLALVAITIGVTYFTTNIIASFWYIILLVLYYRSDDEPMWLAFFLVTVDGFMGFMGLYTVTLSIFPGLPAIELSQFYILLTAVKAYSRKLAYPVYYRKYMQILGIYLVIQVVWGQFMGLSHELNLYMRVLKTILPFLLIFSLPRLMPDLNSYKRFFGIIFIVVVSAFALQIFTLLTGIYPFENIVAVDQQIEESGEFRTFFNATSTLIGLLGSLIFLSIRGRTGFNNWFLLLVVFSSGMMAVISATRGWIIAFGVIILLSGLIVRTLDIRKIAGMVFISGILIIIGARSDRIRNQIEYSKERLLTVESISSGDLTAEGTLHRLDVRGPRVMAVWKQNPLFGWGFSDMGFRANDGHVGNQSLLMFSGIIGFVLLNGFLLYFSYKNFVAYRRSGKTMPYRHGYLIFIIFVAGWFIIHSTSGQQFAFTGLPLKVFPQAITLGLSAIYYNFSYMAKKKRYD